jgi:HEAT repeat protein
VEGRNGLWALGACLVVALVMLVAVAVGILRYMTAATVASIRPIIPSPPAELAVAHRDPAARPFGTLHPDAALQLRIRMLEAMVEDHAAHVRQQAALLRAKMAELEELQARYDTMVAMTLEAVDSPPKPRESAVRLDAASEGANRDAVLLSAKLDLARAVHESLVSELDSLQGELTRAYQEIERLKAAVSPRVEGLSAEVRLLETISGHVLSRIGKGAVPALCEALLDADPIVRRWAANVLGRIGPDAGEAVDALAALALTDADSTVQDAARGALLAIER